MWLFRILDKYILNVWTPSILGKKKNVIILRNKYKIYYKFLIKSKKLKIPTWQNTCLCDQQPAHGERRNTPRMFTVESIHCIHT